MSLNDLKRAYYLMKLGLERSNKTTRALQLQYYKELTNGN